MSFCRHERGQREDLAFLGKRAIVLLLLIAPSIPSLRAKLHERMIKATNCSGDCASWLTDESLYAALPDYSDTDHSNQGLSAYKSAELQSRSNRFYADDP
jgi:hypothetical protein